MAKSPRTPRSNRSNRSSKSTKSSKQTSFSIPSTTSTSRVKRLPTPDWTAHQEKILLVTIIKMMTVGSPNYEQLANKLGRNTFSPYAVEKRYKKISLEANAIMEDWQEKMSGAILDSDVEDDPDPVEVVIPNREPVATITPPLSSDPSVDSTPVRAPRMPETLPQRVSLPVSASSDHVRTAREVLPNAERAVGLPYTSGAGSGSSSDLGLPLRPNFHDRPLGLENVPLGPRAESRRWPVDRYPRHNRHSRKSVQSTQNGQNGQTEQNGQCGQNSHNGHSGQNGQNGQTGQSTQNGQNGQNGCNGHPNPSKGKKYRGQGRPNPPVGPTIATNVHYYGREARSKATGANAEPIPKHQYFD